MLEHWQLEMTEKKLVAMIETLEDRIKVLEKELEESKKTEVSNLTVIVQREINDKLKDALKPGQPIWAAMNNR